MWNLLFAAVCVPSAFYSEERHKCRKTGRSPAVSKHGSAYACDYGQNDLGYTEPPRHLASMLCAKPVDARHNK